MHSIQIPDALYTNRLLLRGPLPADAEEFHTALVESLPALRPWFWWAQPTPTPASSAAFIAESHCGFVARRQMDWLVFLCASQLFIGLVSFYSRDRGTVDWSQPTLLLTYWLRTGYTGQGYMTEAVAAIVDLAFSVPSITSLEIHCDVANEPSAALAERLGFDYWKTIPDGDTWEHVYVKERG